jgi:tRNA A-37 threonylcarbamoyl transferase component Bud32
MHAVMGSGRLIAGRYRLDGPIGRGAMGVVWRGRDELLGRDVAVKEVQITAQASAADAEAIYQRTLREARTAARLSHPGVVTVFDVVEENGSPWVVMELVDARSLDRVVAADGPLPPLRAAELGAGLLEALASAHAAGVLHRDVKPSNVLVNADGKAVLTDFGIATFTEDPAITQVGMVMGTPGFTAPERVRGHAATPASDLWSLGATLYAAVEGRGPFYRPGGAMAICAAVATEDAPQAPSAGPLGPVIGALLGRDPDTRPDAATAARMLAEATVAARATSPASPDTTGLMPAETAAPAGADSGHYGDGGPVLWQPLKPAPGGSGGGAILAGSADGAVLASSAAHGDVPDGGTDANTGRRRQIVLAAAVATLAAAAVVGWALYPGPQTSRAANNPADPGITAPGAAGLAAGPSGSAGAGHPPGSTPTPGQSGAANSAGAGNPSSGSSGKPKASPSSSPGPTPSPSPSPSPTGPVLPPGYAWHRFTAAAMGSTAGFEIGVPSPWQQSVTGLSAHLDLPASNFALTVSLAPWKYAGPLTQAQYLQARYAKTDKGYKELTLGAVGFKAIGGFQAAPAAELKFRWTKLSGGSVTELIVLVTLTTKAGAQPYAIAVSAPAATFSVADGVFETAMTTFRPLPS